MTEQEKKAKKPTPKRLATEARIIAAFERVLRDRGAEGMRVNAVVEEAGVGKGLLYDYFGGMEGLAEAWVEQADFIPSVEAIAGEPLDTFADKPAAERIAQVNRNYADMLRRDELAARLLTEELIGPSAMSKPLDSIRQHIGESHEALFMEDEAFADPDAIAVIFILQAAANYLALRAHSSPNYNGIPIDTDEGWESMLSMMDRVARLLQA